MKPEYADEVIDLMRANGSSENKLRPFKAFVVKVFTEEGRRATAEELLEMAKKTLNIPDYRPQDHENYIRFCYIKQLVETGEYKPLRPSYDDGFDDIKQQLRSANQIDKSGSNQPDKSGLSQPDKSSRKQR